MRYIENELYCKDIEKAIEQCNMDYFREKKLLILGATGLIGSFLVDCLLYANWKRKLGLEIYATGRNHRRLQERFGNETECLHFVECDVAALEWNVPVDVIIHVASNAYPKAFREQPVETMMANILGTYKVLKAASRNLGCRVLYVSSAEVQERVDHLMPRACYPISKMAAETLCLSYVQEYGVDVVIARPCHTFGPNVTESDNRATAQFVANAVQRQDIILKSEGQQIRSYAYIADCASGLLKILTEGEIGQVYGVATDEACSIFEFAQLCANVSGRRVVFEQASETEKAEVTPIQQQVVLNTELCSLGWKPEYTIKQGIEHSIMIQRSLGGL